STLHLDDGARILPNRGSGDQSLKWNSSCIEFLLSSAARLRWRHVHQHPIGGLSRGLLWTREVLSLNRLVPDPKHPMARPVARHAHLRCQWTPPRRLRSPLPVTNRRLSGSRQSRRLVSHQDCVPTQSSSN